MPVAVRVVGALFAFAVAAGAKSPPERECIPMDGWLNGPAYLAWIADGKNYRAVVAPSSAEGVSEISITRTSCLGKCLSFSATIRADGTVCYEGYCDVAHLGQRSGKIDSWRFQRLARLAIEIGFIDLERGYAESVTDQAAVYTSVVQNARRKTVMDYASTGPAKLWALEQMIDETVAEAAWAK
jgi:hypothetical protein